MVALLFITLLHSLSVGSALQLLDAKYKITSSKEFAEDYFGHTMDAGHGGHLAIGASADNDYAGSITVDKNTTIKPPSTSLMHFGASIALNKEFIVVGDEDYFDSKEPHLYVYTSSSAAKPFTLIETIALSGWETVLDVDISDENTIVASVWDYSNSRSAVHVYEKARTTWSLAFTHQLTEGYGPDHVAVSGQHIAVVGRKEIIPSFYWGRVQTYQRIEGTWRESQLIDLPQPGPVNPPVHMHGNLLAFTILTGDQVVVYRLHETTKQWIPDSSIDILITDNIMSIRAVALHNDTIAVVNREGSLLWKRQDAGQGVIWSAHARLRCKGAADGGFMNVRLDDRVAFTSGVTDDADDGHGLVCVHELGQVQRN